MPALGRACEHNDRPSRPCGPWWSDAHRSIVRATADVVDEGRWPAPVVDGAGGVPVALHRRQPSSGDRLATPSGDRARRRRTRRVAAERVALRLRRRSHRRVEPARRAGGGLGRPAAQGRAAAALRRRRQRAAGPPQWMSRDSPTPFRGCRGLRGHRTMPPACTRCGRRSSSPADRTAARSSLPSPRTAAVPSLRQSTCRSRRPVTARAASTATPGTTAAWTSPPRRADGGRRVDRVRRPALDRPLRATAVAASPSPCSWPAKRPAGRRVRRPSRSGRMVRWRWRGRRATTTPPTSGSRVRAMAARPFLRPSRRP